MCCLRSVAAHRKDIYTLSQWKFFDFNGKTPFTNTVYLSGIYFGTCKYYLTNLFKPWNEIFQLNYYPIGVLKS